MARDYVKRGEDFIRKDEETIDKTIELRVLKARKAQLQKDIIEIDRLIAQLTPLN